MLQLFQYDLSLTISSQGFHLKDEVQCVRVYGSFTVNSFGSTNMCQKNLELRFAILNTKKSPFDCLVIAIFALEFESSIHLIFGYGALSAGTIGVHLISQTPFLWHLHSYSRSGEPLI